VKVYLDEGGKRRLIGRADVPEDAGPAFEVLMVDAAAPSIVEALCCTGRRC